MIRLTSLCWFFVDRVLVHYVIHPDSVFVEYNVSGQRVIEVIVFKVTMPMGRHGAKSYVNREPKAPQPVQSSIDRAQLLSTTSKKTNIRWSR